MSSGEEDEKLVCVFPSKLLLFVPEHLFDGSRKLKSLSIVTLDPGRSRAKVRALLLLSDFIVIGKVLGEEEPKSYEYEFGHSLGQCSVSLKDKPIHDLHCLELTCVTIFVVLFFLLLMIWFEKRRERMGRIIIGQLDWKREKICWICSNQSTLLFAM